MDTEGPPPVLYTFRPSDLPKLDLQVDKGTNFAAWRIQWECCCNLSGLAHQVAEKQVEALSLCLSRETLSILHNLGLTTAERKDVPTIIQALQRYVDGQVNETVERRNFRRRVQQPGEGFDDFLISLRELAKTCRFCSESCTEKNIRDQIIEGISDGDTIEYLLQQNELTLDDTVASREAAKRHRSDITLQEPGLVAAICQPQQPGQHSALTACTGCGYDAHKGGRRQCPAYNQLCSYCHKLGHFARVCRSKPTKQHDDPRPRYQPRTNAIHVRSQQPSHIQLYTMTEVKAEPAPTITVQISSSTGTRHIEVLPDSGADISAAGQGTMKILGQHIDNLLPSNISPRTVNGTSMTPLGRIPVTIQLGEAMYKDNLHIYPGVSGALISWKAAKGLGILHPHYPYPITEPCMQKQPNVSIQTATTNSSNDLAAEDLVMQFPTVFDGNIRVMEGETFHISLCPGAVPFCVKTPRAIPFAYRDKLKVELELLQNQGIITPVTEVMEWCAPIVVTPKKGSDRIRMCVDLSRLNRYVQRERYQSPTPADAVADIAAGETQCIPHSALSNAKAHLTGAPTLAFFNAERPMRLCTDASRQGVGFILQQQSSARKWLLIQAGSRFLTPTETRYATIELELLAVAWSVTRCKVFLLGLQNFTIIIVLLSQYSTAIDWTK